jgi:glycosyltransferase involved in cell wall biosynthesis
MAAMKFSFLVLTWNRRQMLEICVDKLITSIGDRVNCEIIVMDNASSDSTRELLESYRDNPLMKSVFLEKDHGLNAYKELFRLAQGDYMVTVDDDVIEFPFQLDRIFSEYMELFPDYGYLALNVVQNEFTNGAKPGPERYSEITREGRVVENGPAGGWCACFRRRDYEKIRFRLKFFPLSMKHGEDGFLVRNFRTKLRLECGIIRDAVCLHACGPHYAKQFGYLDREIDKYSRSGLNSLAEQYEKFRLTELPGNRSAQTK